MKKNHLFCLIAGLAISTSASEKALLAIPGPGIYKNNLDTPPGPPWKAAKGKWELVEGAMRGTEIPEDKHGAVTRLPNKLQDFILEFEFKLEGARAISLSINAVKDHMARIAITTKSVTVQRDDNDHDGPDKSVIFARFPADFTPGTWHKVRLEMVGDVMLGQVDDLVAWGRSDLFKTPKMAPGFTVGGQSADFRNLSIREATLNPAWESLKANLPEPGSKVAPGPTKGAAKGKGKKNATE